MAYSLIFEAGRIVIELNGMLDDSFHYQVYPSEGSLDHGA